MRRKPHASVGKRADGIAEPQVLRGTPHRVRVLRAADHDTEAHGSVFPDLQIPAWNHNSTVAQIEYYFFTVCAAVVYDRIPRPPPQTVRPWRLDPGPSNGLLFHGSLTGCAHTRCGFRNLTSKIRCSLFRIL